MRIYKSRTSSTLACKNGKISLSKKILKPSFLIEPGMELTVKKNGFLFTYKVHTLIEKRVSASIAVTCYENLTSQDELNKYNLWFTSAFRSEWRARGTGRPTKKERREIEQIKSNIPDGWELEEE